MINPSKFRETDFSKVPSTGKNWGKRPESQIILIEIKKRTRYLKRCIYQPLTNPRKKLNWSKICDFLVSNLYHLCTTLHNSHNVPKYGSNTGCLILKCFFWKLPATKPLVIFTFCDDFCTANFKTFWYLCLLLMKTFKTTLFDPNFF